eukprot:scaffold83915_cov19-Tisochrysis_lutea.AAC.2
MQLSAHSALEWLIWAAVPSCVHIGSYGQPFAYVCIHPFSCALIGSLPAGLLAVHCQSNFSLPWCVLMMMLKRNTAEKMHVGGVLLVCAQCNARGNFSLPLCVSLMGAYD